MQTLQKNNITVCIVTRNRQEKIENCLNSLLEQPIFPYEILIIDGSDDHRTHDVIQEVREKSNIKIRELKNNDTNVIKGRILALRKVKTRWLIFIDDDCIATNGWLLEFSKAIEQERAESFLGHVVTKHSNNCFSLASDFFHSYWKKINIEGRTILDLEILDTKNCAYDLNFIRKHNLNFRDYFFDYSSAAAEDSDMGMQLYVNHANAKFVQSAIVIHEDPISWSVYFKKLINLTKAHLVYEEKWLDLRKKFISKKMDAFSYFFTYMSQNKISKITQIKTLIIVGLSILLRCVLRIKFLIERKKSFTHN